MDSWSFLLHRARKRFLVKRIFLSDLKSPVGHIVLNIYILWGIFYTYIMKIDRLLGILTALLENSSLTAPQLAERFQVSRRTIIRDIDSLDRAGFPIVTQQGAGGGISLMEGFSIDGKAVRKEEMEQIITGLQGLASISTDSSIDLLLSRLTSQKQHAISIDLSSFYKGSLSEKIDLFTNAINDSFCVRFLYFSPAGEEWRLVEPIKILYRWSDWYLSAYCLHREDFRFFKLNRLWQHELTDNVFQPRVVPQDRDEPGKHLHDETSFEVLFDPSVKYLIVESYGPDCYRETPEGKLHFKRGFTNRDYIISWILQFGDKAKVLQPHFLVEDIKRIARNILET